MGLDFAIDALYQAGWNATQTQGLAQHKDGRAYPSPQAARAFFEDHGYLLTIKHIQLFGCHRAEWLDPQGVPAGAVVGGSEDEAAVYAMSRLLAAAQPA